MWIKRFTLIALSAVITVLAGCGESSDNPTQPDEGGGDQTKKWSAENLVENSEYRDIGHFHLIRMPVVRRISPWSPWILATPDV